MMTFLIIYLIIGAVLTTIVYLWALYDKDPDVVNANLFALIICLITITLFYPFLYIYYCHKKND